MDTTIQIASTCARARANGCGRTASLRKAATASRPRTSSSKGVAPRSSDVLRAFAAPISSMIWRKCWKTRISHLISLASCFRRISRLAARHMQSARAGSRLRRSCLNAHDPGLSLATDVAKALLVASAEVERLRGGGRNSRIYRVRCRGQSFALKQYPSRADDPRDRLGTEVAALELMQSHKIDAVPRVIAVDQERNFVLLSWIDGVPVGDAADTDIDSAVHFLASIHTLRLVPEAA